MTVITHSLSEKKLQKEPLVQEAEAAVGGQEVTGRTRTLVRVVRQRLQPVNQRAPLLSACVFVSALVLFCVGMAACGYLYQQYQHYQVLEVRCHSLILMSRIRFHSVTMHRCSSATSVAGVASRWPLSWMTHQLLRGNWPSHDLMLVRCWAWIMRLYGRQA